ncbi:MAG: carbamoyltransferase HypF [Betaproteobacteria bacterium HGW-Betaproteobacteria-10]|nr:MAG: carbamoyltransferase HypF [Betaproteobacteria bacterium HGW-Betaproteobacteria-10]
MSARLIGVRGLVQGVGFRPYVWRLANELELQGWVRNDGGGVTIAVDGEKVAEFLLRLPLEIPRLARIDRIEELAASDPTAPRADFFSRQIESAAPAFAPGFFIAPSVAGEVSTAIGPDAALCAACIADICQPQNRRWRYAFTTCTHCGPRYTVSRRIPYDRAQTSLADFPLCPACAVEYGAPVDRRFHAETTCCPVCGPQLSLVDAAAQPLAGDPIGATLDLLRNGKIVAIKGLGGFHLACDARNALTVAELRQRKQREAKPFAVMALNVASLSAYAQIGEAEQALLQSPAAPIVLCPKAAAELPGVAPDLAWLGVMLPPTPLHLLLWHEAARRPAGTDWLKAPSDFLLVMTSANPHGEPLVIANDEALVRLAGIADAYLMHDRDIVVRCDDSVLRVDRADTDANVGDINTPGGAPLRSGKNPGFPLAFIRRARGYTPVPIPLADDGPVVLALGGHLKNSICVMKGRQAFLSQHIGSLDNAAAVGFLEETVSHLLDILDVRPELIAHDLHPDYQSTHLARRLAADFGVPSLGVAHHHAHIASICAEHGVDEALLGLAIDGVGLGPDGGLWGGELLRIDGAQCQRLGHLRPLALPGGDRAAREPWRMAASALQACGRPAEIPEFIARRYPGRDGARIALMLERQLNCPPTSSLGRLFDAAAGLLGLCAEVRYEGQAAMQLEGLAARHGPVLALPGGMIWREQIADFSPLLSHLADCPDAAYGAALFHATLAAGLAECLLAVARVSDCHAASLVTTAGASVVATKLAPRQLEAIVDPAVNRKKQAKIAIGGGCAMNAVLLHALRQPLEAAGWRVLEARQAPPNDGGLALGQAWIARRHEVKD